MKYVAHNAAVDVDTVSSGTIAIIGTTKNDTRALIRITDPAPNEIYFANGVSDIYTPKLQLIDEYQITGKFDALFQQFYLLGFGSSGKELQKAYTVNSVGNETVGAQKAAHLQLVPKAPYIAKEFTKVEMWLAENTGYPAQLRFTSPAGDTTTVVYTNLAVNPTLSEGDLKLKAPSGVRKRKIS